MDSEVIGGRIDAFPEALAPLRDAVRRHLDRPVALVDDGTLNIGHRPWVAELNYLFTLYPGIDRDRLDHYVRARGIVIPEVYAEVLGELNGAFCFGMALCGVPQSMASRGLLNRWILQCHDLATAATAWVGEYRVPAGLFHFGGRDYSKRETVGYFFDGDRRILCIKHRGKVLGEWTSFAEFLADELKASEALEQTLRPGP